MATTRYAVLLRGVNVGRDNALPMAELRAMLEQLGCAGVRTYVQSGNAVFDASLGPAELTSGIEASLADRMGRPIATTLRTRAQMDAVASANPFADQAEEDPRHVCVIFLSEAPPAELSERVPPTEFEPERYATGEREVYCWYPDGQGRSPLAKALGAVAWPGTATTRNWSTVTALRRMLAEEA